MRPAQTNELWVLHHNVTHFVALLASLDMQQHTIGHKDGTCNLLVLLFTTYAVDDILASCALNWFNGLHW